MFFLNKGNKRKKHKKSLLIPDTQVHTQKKQYEHNAT